MTPAVLQYRALEHWDGKLPEYNAGQLPLLTFDVTKLGGAGGLNEAARQKMLRDMLQQTAPSAAAGPAESPAADPHATVAAPPAPAPPAQPH
jgi:hypothetical protein